VARVRLCEPLPALPADPREVSLSRHAVTRYAARHYGEQRRAYKRMHDELRALVDAGEMVRWRPEFLPPAGRFQRREAVIGYAVIEAHGCQLALPLQIAEDDGRTVIATTVLCPRSDISAR
jgi:hypothetical protein